MNLISFVLFDFDHTLGTDDHLEERVLFSILKKHGAIASPESVRGSLQEFQAGRLSLSGLLSPWFGPGMAELSRVSEEYRAACLKEAEELVKPFPGVAETFDALAKREIPFGILSNGWAALQHAKARAIGFPGPVLTSEEVGAWKPDVRAFQGAARAFGFSIPETLYVGDSPQRDVAGAKEAGMQAAWVNTDGRQYPPGLIPPDFVLASIADLIDRIG